LRIDNKDEGIPITALREMCILKSLKHENIVTLHEIIQDVDRIVLIFEYIDNDLKMYIDKNKGIRDNNIIKVIKINNQKIFHLILNFKKEKKKIYLKIQLNK
jgi:serine/threonine protein kinase